MRYSSIYAILLIIWGCSAPILKISDVLNKYDNIKILVYPFEDFTNQYKKDYNVEKAIANAIDNNFKGILYNPNEAPGKHRYKKIENPYILKFIS